MKDVIDNREMMRNREREVCRACGSQQVHTKSYGSSTPECVKYLVAQLREAEAGFDAGYAAALGEREPDVCEVCGHPHPSELVGGDYFCDSCGDKCDPMTQTEWKQNKNERLAEVAE